MNEGRLGVVGEERDLGLRITNDLKASAHCAYVCTRANRVLGMIIAETWCIRIQTF